MVWMCEILALFRRLAYLIGLTLAVVACSTAGPGSRDFDQRETLVTGGEHPTTGAATTTGFDLSTGRTRGGALNYPVARCGIPDPAIDDAVEERNVLNPAIVTEIHSGLTIWSAESPVGYELALAETMYVSEDRHRYLFTLRDGLSFSDASPVDSSDVKWSWERSLRVATDSSRAGHVLGMIVGAKDAKTGVSDLDGFRVIDERRFEVTLERPYANFPLLLTDPVASVLRPENVETWPAGSTNRGTGVSAWYSDESEHLVVGTGPFRLLASSDSASGAACTLERNEHYWGEMPMLGRVNLVPVYSTAPANPLQGDRVAREAFRDGKIDLALRDADGVETRSTAWDDSAEVMARIASEPSYAMLVFNPTVPPFDDVAFRRALVDSSNVREHLPSGLSNATTNRILPDSVLPASARRRVGQDSTVGFESNPPSAPDSLVGVELTYVSTVPPPDWRVQTLRSIFGDWERTLGVSVSLESDPSLLIRNRREDDRSMILVSGTLQVPDALQLIKRIVDAVRFSETVHEFREVSRRLDMAASEFDDVRRAELVADIESLLINRALVLPIGLWETDFEVRIQPWVKGFEYRRYPHSLFKDVWLEDVPDGRQR